MFVGQQIKKDHDDEREEEPTLGYVGRFVWEIFILCRSSEAAAKKRRPLLLKRQMRRTISMSPEILDNNNNNDRIYLGPRTNHTFRHLILAESPLSC